MAEDKRGRKHLPFGDSVETNSTIFRRCFVSLNWSFGERPKICLFPQRTENWGEQPREILEMAKLHLRVLWWLFLPRQAQTQEQMLPMVIHMIHNNAEFVTLGQIHTWSVSVDVTDIIPGMDFAPTYISHRNKNMLLPFFSMVDVFLPFLKVFILSNYALSNSLVWRWVISLQSLLSACYPPL